MLLAAGLGTRLRPLTSVRAKPAVPVNGRPLARRILSWLASHGIQDAVVNLHHRPETVAAVVGDGSDLGLRVRYSWEQPVLGSAGGPRHALPLLTDHRDGPFLIVNADTLSTVDLTALLARHAASGSMVTMALIPNPEPRKYGGVTVRDGYVIGFSRAGAPGESFHFVGVQAAEASAFAGLEDGVPAESVNTLYPRLMAGAAGAIAAFVSDASFSDIGTPRDYLATSLRLAEIEGPDLVSRRGLQVDDSATIERTVVWDDVSIGRHVRLTECIVGDGVRVPDGAAFERSVIVRQGALAPAADERVEGDLLIRPIR